jgi:hypothetical protein
MKKKNEIKSIIKPQGNLITASAKNNLSDMVTDKTFIPPIKVTYKTSDQFATQKAKLGDFFFEDQSLGSSIKAVALAYNYQVMALDSGDKSFKDGLTLPESDIKFRNRPEYVSFCQKNAGDDIVDGVNILTYLVDYEKFGSLFAKKKLLRGGLQFMEQSNKTTICTVTTVKKGFQKLEWYVLEVAITKDILNVEGVDEKLAIFNGQSIFKDVEIDNVNR